MLAVSGALSLITSFYITWHIHHLSLNCILVLFAVNDEVLQQCSPEVRQVLRQLGDPKQLDQVVIETQESEAPQPTSQVVIETQESEAPQLTLYDPVTMPALPKENLQGKILF